MACLNEKVSLYNLQLHEQFYGPLEHLHQGEDGGSSRLCDPAASGSDRPDRLDHKVQDEAAVLAPCPAVSSQLCPAVKPDLHLM